MTQHDPLIRAAMLAQAAHLADRAAAKAMEAGLSNVADRLVDCAANCRAESDRVDLHHRAAPT